MEIPSFNALIQKSIIDHWDMDALTDYKGATLQFHDVARKIEKLHIMFENSGVVKVTRLPFAVETVPTGQWPSWQLLPMELSPCLSCTSLCQSKSITSSTIAMPNCCLWAMSLPRRLTLPRCLD